MTQITVIGLPFSGDTKSVRILLTEQNAEKHKKEKDMKNFLVLHYGFVKPTPEEMGEWNKWFKSIADRQVERGHFPTGREISKSGVLELSMARDSITGYTVIKAENLDEAEKIAKECPIVDSTRVYEVMNG